MKILHITTHMGGGAGNAISDIILRDQRNEHRLICLQGCEKRQFINRCLERGIYVVEVPGQSEEREEIAWADVVILHWWHHPVMCGFLAAFPEIPCRLVLWSHISGCAYPVLHMSFIDLFDRVFLTTPYSYDNQEWKSTEREEIRRKSDIVYGLGDLEALKDEVLPHRRSNRFVVGYVGTLGNSKLSEDFVEFCAEVIARIPTVRFLMVGDLTDAGWLLDEIDQRKLGEYFEFTGYCIDVKSQLARMDVFGYPLSRQHFGTTENVILEAMLAKLPVVLLNQNTEKYIVSHLKTGMLVRDKQEYADIIYELSQNAELRTALGERARESVLEKYSVQKNMGVFQAGLEKARQGDKHLIHFTGQCGQKPYEWFLSGLGREEARWFRDSLQEGTKKAAEEYIRTCRPILRARSKSSVLHFADSYPEDRVLYTWKKIIEGGQK